MLKGSLAGLIMVCISSLAFAQEKPSQSPGTAACRSYYDFNGGLRWHMWNGKPQYSRL